MPYPTSSAKTLDLEKRIQESRLFPKVEKEGEWARLTRMAVSHKSLLPRRFIRADLSSASPLDVYESKKFPWPAE
jgi:hypothetical protein